MFFFKFGGAGGGIRNAVDHPIAHQAGGEAIYTAAYFGFCTRRAGRAGCAGSARRARTAAQTFTLVFRLNLNGRARCR